jgi:HlyD family secretion protein
MRILDDGTSGHSRSRDNDDQHLLIGAIWGNSAVLKVPASVLFRVGETWGVFVIEDGSALLRHVEVGHRNALEAEIMSGLRENEAVVLHPSNDINEGIVVQPRTGKR